MTESTVPFDRDELYRLLHEISGLLTELGCIDRALDYIRSRDESHRLDSGRTDEITVHLGTQYPFKRVLRLADRMGGNEYEVQSDLEAMSEEAATWATQNMGTLEYYTAWIAHPTVGFFDHLVIELEEVRNTLKNDLDYDIGELANNLGDWKGVAAEDFADNFYSPLGSVFDNQAYLADKIAGALSFSKGVTRLSQHSLMNAVVYAHEALHEQLRKRMEDNAGPSLKEILILASSATQLMGAFGFPVTDKASALLDFAAVNIPENASEPYKIEGATAGELFNTLFDATRQISHNTREAYTGMEAELERVNSEINDLRLDRLLVPRRPAVADGFTGDDFHHVTSSRYTD